MLPAQRTSRFPVGADNTILTASSASANGLGYFEPGIARPGIVSGHYYGPANFASISTANVSSGTMTATPVYIGQRTTFTAIRTYVTAATSVGAHFGVYRNSGGLPGALVTGSDVTISTLTAAAENDAVFATPIVLDPGSEWIVILTNGSATSNATASNQPGYLTGTSDMNTGGSYKYTKLQTYGALPDPFGTVTQTRGSQVHLYFGLKAQ